MRIIGFSLRWVKLWQPEFTTFRVPRKDKDWYGGEQVQVVYRPRSKNRNLLCLAEIIIKETTTFKAITETEAIVDGFSNAFSMWEWLKKAHRGITMDDPLNKLTLRHIQSDELAQERKTI